jgi:DNA repair exonuclease SbcCD ATPase subunit
MSQILFKNIKWKNLLSTGNSWTEIFLNKSENTLVIGKNGSGKSTLLDALTFVLFNKPFRNINKPLMVNSINDKEMVVEIEFVIGKKEYKIIRGIKPAIFEIYQNGVLLDQSARAGDYQNFLEKNILHMNYKSFTQIVILGMATFTPFMQLSAADRRAIIEELLDIKIFSSMNIILKQKKDQTKEELNNIKTNLNILEIKIESLKSIIQEMNTNVQQKISRNKREIVSNRKEIGKLTETINSLQTKIAFLQFELLNEDSTKDRQNKLNNFGRKINENIKLIRKEIQFYTDNNNCPTCHQDIQKDFKLNTILKKSEKLNELKEGYSELDKQTKAVTTKLEEFANLNKRMMDYNLEMVKYNTSITSLHDRIKSLNEEIDEFKENKDHIEKEQDKLVKTQQDKLIANQSEERLSTDRHYIELASGLLKDSGIKSKIIKQYLPIMNKHINKYLSAMDFFVNFNLNENFEESIKSRYRDEFSYNNFSEGEKQKIDLALLFTWRTIARMKNSISTNLLVLDEVFDSSLDTDGTEELLKILQTFGKDTNILVISHKGDLLFDKFKSVIRFEKNPSGFSKMVKEVKQ